MASGTAEEVPPVVDPTVLPVGGPTDDVELQPSEQQTQNDTLPAESREDVSGRPLPLPFHASLCAFSHLFARESDGRALKWFSLSSPNGGGPERPARKSPFRYRNLTF